MSYEEPDWEQFKEENEIIYPLDDPYENYDKEEIDENPMKTFKQYLEEKNVCKSAIEWAGDKTIEEAVRDCHRGDWLLWLAGRVCIPLKELTLAKGHCAATVLHLMKDERSRSAVKIAIAFGEGKATKKELDKAAKEAFEAYRSCADLDYGDINNPDYADSMSTCAAYMSYMAASSDLVFQVAFANYGYFYFVFPYFAEKLEYFQAATADICRKYIGELTIEKVNEILKS